MDANLIMQCGVGGILAYLIIKEVLSFLKCINIKRKESNGGEKGHPKSEPFEICYECRDYLKQLYDMHNVKDSDGVYAWYVRRSLQEAIISLSDNIAAQTDIFRELVFHLKEETKKIDDLASKVDKKVK